MEFNGYLSNNDLCYLKLQPFGLKREFVVLRYKEKTFWTKEQNRKLWIISLYEYKQNQFTVSISVKTTE